MKQDFYRSDIDGLRAIAVLSVLGFHIMPWKMPGGFIGVDIFFVISGFLITRILWRDMSSDQFTMVGFYSKRIKRLFPALIVLLAVCSLIQVFRESSKHTGDETYSQSRLRSNTFLVFFCSIA